MHEFDILRSSEHDLSNAVLWDKIKALLSQGNAVLLMSPPCDTWSRVRHARPGPPPLRSLAHPWGFPWLADKHREAVESANTLIKFCCELAVFAHSHQVPFIMEHPEDLGLAQDGVRPASIWQLDIVQDLVPSCNSITFAFFQCAYGAASAKPTRLISNLAAWTFQVPSYSGFPHFDSGGRYRGPLPPRCGHRHPPLMGRDGAAWRTAASAAYPPLINRWLVVACGNRGWKLKHATLSICAGSRSRSCKGSRCSGPRSRRKLKHATLSICSGSRSRSCKGSRCSGPRSCHCEGPRCSGPRS